jgi:hypothetical protein
MNLAAVFINLWPDIGKKITRQYINYGYINVCQYYEKQSKN